MQRFLIVMCIIAALIMAAFKPARGDSTGAEKCTAAKISAMKELTATTAA